MRPSDLARLVTAAVAGVMAPYVWVQFAGSWAVHIYVPLIKLAWSVFALKGPLVFWTNTVLESIVLGSVFGLGLWALGSTTLHRLVVLFWLGFLVTFFGYELAISDTTGDEKLAFALIAAPSVVLLLAATVGTCWVLPRRTETAGA